jgi:hypothetical protein
VPLSLRGIAQDGKNLVHHLDPCRIALGFGYKPVGFEPPAGSNLGVKRILSGAPQPSQVDGSLDLLFFRPSASGTDIITGAWPRLALTQQGPQPPHSTDKNNRAYAGEDAEGRLVPEVSECPSRQGGGRTQDES